MLLISLYLVIIGINEIGEFQKAKQVFITYEKLKVKTFVNYEQYGGFGFKILMDVSPLSIFFDSGDTMRMTKANIDTSEVIDVLSSKRGKGKLKDFFRPFPFSSFFLVTTGILFFFSGALIPGKRALKLSRKFLSIVSAAINRFLVIECLCLLLQLILFAVILVAGISFNVNEINVLFDFGLYLISFHAVAFFAGGFIRVITLQKKLKTLIVGVFVVLAATLITPGLNMYLYNKILRLEPIEEVFYKKLQTLMDLERKVNKTIQENNNISYEKKLEIFKKAAADFISTGLKENEKTEMIYLDKMKGLTNLNERISLFWPVSYGLLLTRELSLEGDRQHFNFMNYSLQTKLDFTLFYVKKRFYTSENQVESFIKNNENVFSFKPIILESLLSAVLLNVIYCSVILIATLALLKHKLSQNNGELSLLEWTPRQSMFFFKLCDNQVSRDSIFKYFESLNQYACLDIDNEDLLEFAGMKIGDIIEYYTLDKAPVLKILNMFEITDLNAALDKSTVKRIYAAIILSGTQESIVVNDFCKNVDSVFYGQIQGVLDFLLNGGKSILYLSSDMFTGLNRREAFTNSDIATVDITSISLR